MPDRLKVSAEGMLAPAAWRGPAREAARLAALALVASWLGYYVITGMPQMRLESFVPTVTLHVVAAGAGAFYLSYLLITRRLPGGTPLDWPVLLLLGAYGLATAASIDRRVSFEATLQVLMVAATFYLLSDVRFFRERDLRRALMAVGAAASLYALWVVGNDYADWLSLTRSVEGGLGLGNLFPPTVPRVHDVSDHPNMLAMTLVLILPFYVVTAYRGEALWERLAAGLGLVVAALAIFLTESRGAWVGAVAALGLTVAAIVGTGGVLARLRRRPLLAAPRWAIAGGAGLVVLVVLLAAVIVLGAARWEARPNWLFRGSFTAREDALGAGAEMFSDHPLLGAGPATYALLYPDYSGKFPIHAIHAHNGFLQAAVDLGLVGVAAAALLAGATGWLLWRTYRRGSRPQQLVVIACGAALGGFLVHNLADAANIWKAPLIALAAVAAISVHAYRETEEAQGDPPETDRPPPRREVGAGLLSQLRLIRPQALLRFLPRALAVFIVPVLFVGWARLDSAHYYFDRSLNRLAEGSLLQAVSDIDRAVDIDPDLAIYWLQLGLSEAMAFQAEGPRVLLDQAVHDLRRGIELEPRSALGYANLARALALAGETEGAHDAALEARRLAVSDDTVLLAAGEVFEDIGAHEEALATYGAALSRNGDLADSPFWLESEFRSTRYRQILESSMLIFSDCALGSLAARSEGDMPGLQADLPELAEGCALRVLAAPDDLDQRVALGTILMALGDLEGAFSHLDFAVRRQPDHGPARTALGRWYAARGDLERARQEWVRGGHLEDPEALVLLGDSYPPGEVPSQVVTRLEELLAVGAGAARHHPEGIVYYRSKFARQSPVTMLIPGAWQRAVPGRLLRMQEALARWESEGAIGH